MLSLPLLLSSCHIFRKSFFVTFSCQKSNPIIPKSSLSIRQDTLNVLEWDKLCDVVSSFATTSLGREATRFRIWSLDQTYEESLKLLDETNAAVEIKKHGGCSLDFSSVDTLLVNTAVQHARRGLPVEGIEALAVLGLLQLIETLQLNAKAAIKEDSDWYRRFMPLIELIMELVVNRSLLTFIQKVIDEDGSVKDTASSTLKRARDQVRSLEAKLYQLMDRLIRNEKEQASSLQLNNIDGRWCVQMGADHVTSFQGLLLSSGSGLGSIVEPLSAVPLNDELQQARALVRKAETEVLLLLTEKMQMDLDDIEKLLNSIIELDVINARATYSLSFGGTYPEIFLPHTMSGSFASETDSSGENSPVALQSRKNEWILYLPKAYHPLLLQQYRQKLNRARKTVSHATAEIRRRKLQAENMIRKDQTDVDLLSLRMEVTRLEQSPPIPVDFFIARKTRVLVITGPNTGGKTICLKTIGMATMMAKSGIYVLASEPVRIPWIDFVFADIGDEQSLSQSLSTFSGHLKRISKFQSHATSQSLVLLDEVGAGTNPLEGAALGMALLEAIAETGVLLTIATTHHGELKTLKYSNDAFENACMEFDDVNLKPTYKVLWGVPGRSNAINIAERLGLPGGVIHNAREIYGTASAEINEVIYDMERFKHEFQKNIHEGKHYLKRARELHDSLLVTRRRIMEHCSNLNHKKVQEMSDMATKARSNLHRKVRQLRASAASSLQSTMLVQSPKTPAINGQHSEAGIPDPMENKGSSYHDSVKQSPSSSPIAEDKRGEMPKIGDEVLVSYLGKKATVLKVDPSKEELVVQIGNMKMKLKLVQVGNRIP